MFRLALEVAGIILLFSIASVDVDGKSITEYGAAHGYKKTIDRLWNGPTPPTPAPILKELDQAIKEVQQ